MCLALLSFWYHRSTKKEVKGKKKEQKALLGVGEGGKRMHRVKQHGFPFASLASLPSSAACDSTSPFFIFCPAPVTCWPRKKKRSAQSCGRRPAETLSTPQWSCRRQRPHRGEA